MKCYCYFCFDSFDTLIELDEESGTCPECENDHLIEEKDVRSYVVKTLKTYLDLAEELGIPEREYIVYPCLTCTYFSEVSGEGCDMLHAPHRNCPDFRKKT
jgi:hypothetical protein